MRVASQAHKRADPCSRTVDTLRLRRAEEPWIYEYFNFEALPNESSVPVEVTNSGVHRIPVMRM